MRYRFLRYPGGLEKAVTLSYDDGCIEDIRLASTLDEYGFKGTFNLVGERKKLLTKEQIEECFLKKGHEIAVHGELHIAEGVVRPIDGIRDVLNCRIELEERYKTIIRGMAYPECGITRFANGTTYETVRNYLIELDIAYARTIGCDNNSFELPQDWFEWMPTAHHDNPNIMKWIDEFIDVDLSLLTRKTPKLFYIWGHSYEFERKNNWKHLYDILNKLGKREDIWYATNMEIYEYVTAFNSLITNANHTMMFNPSRYDIWFSADGVTHKINSGETLEIL